DDAAQGEDLEVVGMLAVELVEHHEGPPPVAPGHQLARELAAGDRRRVGLGGRRAPTQRRGERRRGDDRQAEDAGVGAHGVAGHMLPMRITISTTAGPMTTHISDGRMQRMRGMVILTDTMAAFSSARCIRLVRIPSEWTRKARD